jgi:hypothetical protein
MHATLLIQVLVVAVLTLTACSGEKIGSEGAEGDSPCLAGLVLDGRFYEQVPISGKLRTGARIDDAGFSACNEIDAGRTVPTYRLEGVGPNTAFAGEKGGDLYLFVYEGVEDPCAVPYTRC